MSTLAPPVELHGPCSAIFNNTLYVYSPDAFQSLPLESNTKWQKLPSGISVTGGACLIAYPNGDPNQASFYVVGGSTNSSKVIYPGLQSYSFQSKQWENITPTVQVTQNRRHHGAAYLNTSSSILVYGGSQNGDTGPSSQTFLISTQPPYGVNAYSSAAPPVVDPIVLPWDDNRAVVLGGDPTNTKVFTFGPNQGWQDTGVSLSTGLKDRTKVQCALVNGDDASRVLETFDMSVSPNSVSSIVLLEAGGLPAPVGQTVGNSTQPPAKVRQRNTLANWPEYNSTLAPTTTRSGFSLAQSFQGLVVISGGNAQDPLTMFDENSNGWLNTTSFLNAKPTATLSIGGSPASSSTPSASASSSEAPTVGGSSSNSRAHTLTILGAVLGAIFGVCAILILLLLLLRWYRKRRDAGHKRKTSDFPNDKNDRLSFQDRGIDIQPVGRAAEPMGTTPRAADSMAIMSGRDVAAGNQTSTKRTDVFLPSMRFSNTPSPLGKGMQLGEEVHMRDITKPSETKEPPPPRPPRGDRLTDEGWSRYFQGNNASNLAHMSTGQSTYLSQDSTSDYRNSAYPHGSAEVAPLSLGRFSNGRQLNHVATGSPTTAHAAGDGHGTGVAVSEGLVGHISHADSMSMVSEEDDRSNAFSSGIPASIHDGEHLYTVPEPSTRHPPSSTYTLGSYYPNSRDTRIQTQTEAANFEFPLPSDNRVTRWPTHDGENSFPFPAPEAPPESRDSDEYYGRGPQGRQTGNSDMSWLNLGAGTR
jgi:hypothetical protein